MAREPAAAAEESAVGEGRRVPLHRNPWLWAFVAGIVTLTALRPLLRHIPDPPPVSGEVPPFTLTDQNGRPFTRNDLLGRVTIANLFCTGCPSAAPDVMMGMRRIEDAYKERGIDRIGFLSVSADPADTPERLREYAHRIGADSGPWRFLTGDPGVVHDLASNLFRNAPSIAPETDAGRTRPASDAESANARPLVLIDQRGMIRGWYGASESGLDEIYNRAQHVLTQSSREP